MKTIDITGTARTIGLKGQNKRMRKNGNIPCVAYGLGDPKHFSVTAKELKKVLYTPDTYIISLDIDGEKADAIIREAQFHPVTDTVIHVDFLRVNEKDAIELELPVTLTGQAKGVLTGGQLLKMMRRIRVKGIPTELPESISVDISELELGKTIKVSDLSLEGMQVTSPSAAAVASVQIPRALRSGEDEEGEDEEEGEEGSEAPAAE